MMCRNSKTLFEVIIMFVALDNQITRFVLKEVWVSRIICYNPILFWFCISFLQFSFAVGKEIRHYKMYLFLGSQRKSFKLICFRKKFARTDKVSKSGFRVTSNFPLHVYKISILTDKAHSYITIIDQFQKCDKNKSILNQRILHFQFSVCPQVSEFSVYVCVRVTAAFFDVHSAHMYMYVKVAVECICLID